MKNFQEQSENQRKKLERIFESANDKVTRMIRRGQDGKELERALQQRDKALYDLEQFYLNNPTGMNTEQSGSNQNDPKTNQYEGAMAGIKDYFDSIKSGAEEVRAVVSKAFQNMENAIVNFVMTGKLNFAEFTRSILADMARIIVRQAILKPLLGGIFGFDMGGVTGGGTASASGEVTLACSVYVVPPLPVISCLAIDEYCSTG